MESILSLCDTAFSNRRMLDWHYRSQHPALIAVSNRNFYGNKLLLPPAVAIGPTSDGLGVVFRKTPAGGYDRGRTATNPIEADVVAEAVCEFARKYPGKSLGVGTFSVAQRDVIREMIEFKRRADPTLDPFFATGKQDEFFVKNLESIQGDERDVIFISIGYGRGSDNRLTKSFGPINADGGERRLNVLISRAKERCEVFSSITADEIDISSRRPGVVALKEFLQYAEKGYFDVPQRTERTFDSDFEESVAEFLRQHNYKIDPQVGMAGFFIDLGVRDPRDGGRYVLGIECDGATYHSSRSARDRDRLRQEILEARGWTIFRIWSTDWFHRRTEQERRLLDALAAAESGERARQQSRPSSPVPAVSDVADAPRARQQAESGATSAITKYVEASFVVNSTHGPHDAPASEIQRAIEKIVSIEGPIHTDEVARRVATVWRLDRAGSRIQDAAQGALRALLRQGRLDCVDDFWSLASGAVLNVRNRSETDSLTLRKAEYLPPQEIVLAAIEVLGDNVRVSLDELIVEIARRLGFQRTGPELQDAIAAAVSSQVGKALARQEDGSLMLGPRQT